MQSRSRFRLGRLLGAALALGASASIFAQPSGGPYGPQPQRYEIPAGAVHVFFVAPEGKADAPGNALDAPTSIESAVARAGSGDVLVLRGGTYRAGGLVTNQGITLQPYADERPVLKGTRVATEWEALRDNVWRTKWTKLFPQKPADWWRKHREGMRTPLHRFNNDMVFVDGRALQSAAWEGELTADNYHIDYDGGWVYLGFDPAKRVIEITAHDGALSRVTTELNGRKSDTKGFVLRGLTFTQYAYRAIEVEAREPEGLADEATFGKDVVGTTLEDVTITHCSRVAAYLRGDRTVLRRCLVSDTSTEGVYLLAAADCLLEKNIFARNNVERITGYYPSAVKIFNQTHRVVCRDNLVIDQPNSNGIWYDVGNVDGVFINNWIQDCQDGFFFEISKRAICAGNVFVNCDKGVRALNSVGVQVYHNTFVNTVAAFERTERSAVADHFGWHPSTGPDVHERDGHVFVGNLVTADATFPKALLLFGQTKPLLGKLTTPQAARIEGNVYVRAAPLDPEALAAKAKDPAVPAAAAPVGPPLITWAPVPGDQVEKQFATLDEFRAAYPQFEAGSTFAALELGAVFQSPVLRNLQPTRPLPTAAKTPPEVLKLLGWTEADAQTAGAYPVRR